MKPRPPIFKPAKTKVNSAISYTDRIYVKFRDGLTCRLRKGQLTDLGTGDLAGVDNVLSEVTGGKWSRLHALKEKNWTRFGKRHRNI